MVEALLNSKAMRLVINLEFVKKNLKKIENSIYVRNVNRIFNKEDVKIVDGGLYFIISFHFYFTFLFLFFFYF